MTEFLFRTASFIRYILLQVRVLVCHHCRITFPDFMPRFPSLKVRKVAGILHVDDEVTEYLLIELQLGFCLVKQILNRIFNVAL